MKSYVAVALLSTTLIPARAFCQDCLSDKTQYDRSAQELLIHNEADAKRLTSEVMQKATSELHDLITGAILRKLNDGLPVQMARQYIACLQADSPLRNWKEETNLPFASIGRSPQADFVLAYWLFRGGEAVPSLTPFVDLYTKQSGSWALQASTGERFAGFTFFIKANTYPNKLMRLALYGNVIGNPESPLQLEVLDVGRNGFTSQYRSPLLARTSVTSISPHGVVLSRQIVKDSVLTNERHTILLDGKIVKE